MPIMANPVISAESRSAVFMQYAACMHDEEVWHDACASPEEPKVMGYAIRTRRWRYIEWVRFDKGSNSSMPTPLWDQLLGTELYDHTEHDSVENRAESVNVVARSEFAGIVSELSQQLHQGWRHAQRK